jgi:hypothetical protein
MHKDRETPAFQPQQLFHTVNIQQSSIEAAALISATPEATILNCDSPLPCRFCSHQRCVFKKPSTASFPLAIAACTSRTITPQKTASGIFNHEQLPDRHHRLRLHSSAAPGEDASFPCSFCILINRLLCKHA